MEKISIKRELIFWILIIIPLVYLAIVWNALPEQVPVHFGIDGKPNGWTGKWGALTVPGISIGLYLLLLFLPLVDPKKKNYEFFKTNFYKIRLLIIAFFFVFAMEWIYRVSTGQLIMDGRFLGAIGFLMLGLLGNFMINIKPNWFVGVRTPWTLSSDTVWRKTHQLSGRLMFYGGMLCFLINFFITTPAYTIGLLLVYSVGILAFSAGYSFWLFRQEEQAKL